MTNKTALVTGASDGIGLEFCNILAAKGYDLILVARRKAVLNKLAKALSQQYHNINCTAISTDLSKPQGAQKLFATTVKKDLHVDLLINNAGLLQNGFFTDIDLATQENMISVNILALTSLTHLFANAMATRTGGHILNVASLAAWAPIPNQNVYAATKAYVLSFSQALHNELKVAGNGVSVTALCPGYTDTKMMDNPDQGPKLSVPRGMLQSAQEVAEQGIAACLAGKPTVVTGFANRASAILSHLFPKMILANIAGSYYRNNLN